MAESRNPYRSPLISPGAKFASLPPAVRNTVRAQAGTAQIADVIQNETSGRVVYQFLFENPDQWPPLYVAGDGSVLNPNLTVAVGAPGDADGVLTGGSGSRNETHLPESVLAAIRDREPYGEIAQVTQEAWGNRVVYHIIFKNPARSPELFVTGDGTILQDFQGGKGLPAKPNQE